MKALLNWRYYALFLIGTVAVLGICSQPTDDNPNFFTAFLLSKVIGFGAGYLYYRMITHFDKQNKIPELSALIEDEEEA